MSRSNTPRTLAGLSLVLAAVAFVVKAWWLDDPAMVAAPATTLTAPTSASTTTSTSTTTTTTPTTTTTIPEPAVATIESCPALVETPGPVDGDAVTVSRQLTTALICRASDVVVTPPDQTADALGAALFMRAPLVYATPERPFDAMSLGASRVWTDDAALVTAGEAEVFPLPDESAPAPVLVETAADGEVTAEETERAMAAAIEVDPAALIALSPTQAEAAPSAMAVSVAAGGTAVWAAPGDLRASRPLAEAAAGTTQRLLVGDYTADAAWQFDVIANPSPLPGGGHLLFQNRRIVAAYGRPQVPILGVLGEQGPEAATARAAELAAAYATEGVTVLPALDMITTLASSGPGADGDYSEELTVDEVRPWIEAATAAGQYVVLDLQPGRTDFLTQAMRYEELLRLPNVGLALDPEWRLGPDQVHLRQVGTVAAAEINTVAAWLADLTRQERLPQKLLLVHQFKLSMITERDQLTTPPELAVVIQMDGQGPLATKYATWDALLAAGTGGWGWGWKNFYDEDSPTATPDQVLNLEPVPVYVSYQ